jgi:plasmid maintenance system antidote protein VapI
MGPPRHDWFLKEWLRATGKKQADVVKDLDWNKAKISLMVNGKQAYTRDDINELAAYLNINPHELLMHPEDAMALRQLRASARQIVSVPFGGTAGSGEREEEERKIA